MNNDKPNAFLYINTKISYLARKSWWSAGGSSEIKKNARQLHRGAVGRSSGKLPGMKLSSLLGANILASLKFHWFRESFVDGNPGNIGCWVQDLRWVWARNISVRVQILGSITCYYSLKGDILTGSGPGLTGGVLLKIFGISPPLLPWSPRLSCRRAFYLDLINHVFIYLTRVNSTRRKIWK